MKGIAINGITCLEPVPGSREVAHARWPELASGVRRCGFLC